MPIALLAMAAAAPVGAQVPARAHHQLVHHTGEDRVYLIGGSTPRDGGHHYFDDVWTWDGKTWSPGPDLPFPRSSHRVVYDSRASSLLMFGGTSGGSASVEGAVREWRDGQWVERGRADQAALGEPGACMDERRGRLVIYGGAEPGGTFTGATWEWDGSALMRVAEDVGPGARLGHAMAWDPVGERCLLFGGRDSDGVVHGDTWVWSGEAWSRLEVPGPPARWIFTLATDPARRRIVLFGGQDPDGGLLGDTWAWDGAAWSRIATDGPDARMMGAMAFDGEGIVLFGGRARGESGFRDRADTWRLEGGRWRLLRSQEDAAGLIVSVLTEISNGDLFHTGERRELVLVEDRYVERETEFRVSARPRVEPLSSTVGISESLAEQDFPVRFCEADECRTGRTEGRAVTVGMPAVEGDRARLLIEIADWNERSSGRVVVEFSLENVGDAWIVKDRDFVVATDAIACPDPYAC